jgi:large subunit ribosomal protein L21
MYAIIRAGGKQARVSEGDVLDVERIKGGPELTFTPLLLVKEDGTVISDPDKLAKAKVTAEILGENRGPKVDVFKYKAKTGYRRRSGHRQTYSRIQVKKITASARGGAKKKTETSTAEAAQEADTAQASEAAATSAGSAASETKAAGATKGKATADGKAEKNSTAEKGS